jgi:hypothetical protein
METEQIIKTLQEYNDWRRARGKWDVDTFNKGESFFDSVTAHEIGLTIDAAIEELKFSENKLSLVVARQNELIERLKEERDEAREGAEKARDYPLGPDTGLGWKFSWEKGSK